MNEGILEAILLILGLEKSRSIDKFANITITKDVLDEHIRKLELMRTMAINAEDK